MQKSVQYICGQCQKPLTEFMDIQGQQLPMWHCESCEKAPQSEQIKQYRWAYRLYSFFYGPLAVLNMYIIWHGRLRPLLKWYLDTISMATQGSLLDIAIGDGELTWFAGKKVLKNHRLIALDLSREMLKKCVRCLKKAGSHEFILANVEKLPFPSNHLHSIACFGGIHVFQNRIKSLSEITRVLQPGGLFRGSILTRPKIVLAQKICNYYVHLGLLGSSPSIAEIENDFLQAGLKINKLQRNGFMLLFEATK